MNNLRHPDIRVRDIRKLLGYKSYKLVWDRGCDETSEWVLASIESPIYLQKLSSWLFDKNVLPDNEALLINNYWEIVQKICWRDILENPLTYFGKDSFQLYDLDLGWVLEYSKGEIARFGRYDTKSNT